MDFIRVAYKENKDGTRTFYPALQAIESQDLVIRGGQFAAVWDETTGLYNRSIAQTPALIDRWFAKQCGEQLRPGDTIKKVREFENQIFNRFLALTRSLGDIGPELDQKIVFADQAPTKADGATFKMPYSLSTAPHPAWDELCTVLYGDQERLKFEYGIGSVLTGASLRLQKGYVFFGDPGTGKSTIMDVIEALFEGHFASFTATELGNASNRFSMEPFMKNPLLAIDQDTDLSKIEINHLLNKIISHDEIIIDAKGKSLFKIQPRSMLVVGTNKPVKITDAKSGLYRRIVDIHPTGDLFPEGEYHRLTAAVLFELGSIAQHCIDIFNQLGPEYLSSYRPMDMMYRTNDAFNFVQEHRLVLQNGITLKHAWHLYQEWCKESEIHQNYKQYQFRDMLKDYFKEFHEQVMVDGERHRSYYMDLRPLEKFSWKGLAPKGPKSWLNMEAGASIFDELMADQPAQLSTGKTDFPLKKPWDKVTSKLSDIDTLEEHYVMVPKQHIVIDFDGEGETLEQRLENALERASGWPPTYAEVSRGGDGLHLHYDYDGDVDRLAKEDDRGTFEVKTLTGNASLRRRLSASNGLPVATISSGLPIKEDKPVISATTMGSELGLRKQILKGLRKEVWPHTKPSMDFIKKVLDDAVAQGLQFDVTDMYDDILEFALGSSNQSNACLQILLELPLKSEEDIDAAPSESSDEKPLADFDLEIYPNLFVIGYMVEGTDVVVKMVNPTAQQVMNFIDNYRLSGFYVRLYDNHMLWAATLGYSVLELYKLSQQIIVENNRHKLFGAAYALAYIDLYDVAAKKQSLKKWEIELGLPHMEMDLPWDEPVPDDRLEDVYAYLDNDVYSTKAVREHLAPDIRARELLAEMSGLEVCNTNNQHTTRLIFGDLKDTQGELKYTHLSEQFPGYEFDRFASGKDKSAYKGVKVGEGGYVYAEPGMYNNVALLDVASMHPSSIIAMNAFGKYTEKFEALMNQRLDAKVRAKSAPTPDERAHYKALSDALKIVINSVYGLTAASFPNAFKDERNIDNFVAKRGALFMVDLKEFIENELGLKVLHIKTDSVKIQNAEDVHIKAIQEFSVKYGYDMEHEATYERFCLVNDAVYVCRKDGVWDATGAQFKHPVVFKALFSHEEVVPKDYVEVKQVTKDKMYLTNMDDTARTFVGKFGAFVPVLEGRQLVRISDDGKVGAIGGTKGYLWETEEIALKTGKPVDMAYFQKLVDDAMAQIEKFGDYATFVE